VALRVARQASIYPGRRRAARAGPQIPRNGALILSALPIAWYPLIAGGQWMAEQRLNAPGATKLLLGPLVIKPMTAGACL
jgi:hypothetical protein